MADSGAPRKAPEPPYYRLRHPGLNVVSTKTVPSLDRTPKAPLFNGLLTPWPFGQ